MRKHKQHQILKLLQTIRQAQSEGLFADCQIGAQSVGEYIESVEGEGTRTVALLEEYYESLYKASIGEISEKRLRKQLIQIENSVKDELKPNKIEIVFLSYNASMSDSIESIYLTAKNDPECDAYWIPIPYYERNSDGSFASMRYEGAEYYGSDIECTDWREYDIEARHPDIIFTFNPYDGGNYATSVHPDFYCMRLREFTDLLVYVPYFVTINDEIAEHFCTVAGCVYAHKVIVQSVKIRSNYISTYKKHFGSEFGEPEDKFVALGSPKFDKVIRTKREECILPDAWKELIGDRKVILYNTSIAGLLEGGEKYLEKLRYVLNIFRERNGTVLWWRPHPLSLQTYKSMRPGLEEEYRAIVEEYRRDAFGIYDDTTDLHRAIAVSDAYFGDMSSLVVLYQNTGKPIIVLPSVKDDIECEQFRFFLNCIAVCEVNGITLIFDGLSNLLVFDRGDKNSCKFIQSSGRYTGVWVSRNFIFDDKMYIPCGGNEINIVHTKTYQSSRIELDELNTKCLQFAVQRGNFIYGYSIDNAVFFELNTENDEVEHYSIPENNDDLACLVKNCMSDFRFCHRAVEIDDCFEVLLLRKNAIVRFDTVYKRISFISFADIDGEIIDCDFYENCYYFVFKDKNYIGKYNRTNQSFKKLYYPGFHDFTIEEFKWFESIDHIVSRYRIDCRNGNVYLIAYTPAKSYKMDIQTEIFEELSELSGVTEKAGIGRAIFKDEKYCYIGIDEAIFRFDYSNFKCERLLLTTSVVSSLKYNLILFDAIFSTTSTTVPIEVAMQDECGQKIYDYTKDLLKVR